MTDSLDTTPPSSESVNIDLPDAAWELRELAVVAILASIGFLTIAGAIGGIFYGGQSLGFQGDSFWFAVGDAVRWVDASTAALLLGAIAICWWQYGQWTSGSRPSDDYAVLTHVRRLHVLTRWVRIAFGLMVVASIAGVIAAITVSTLTPTQLSFDRTNGLQTVFAALAADVIAAVGFVAAGRVFNASSVHLARFDSPLPEETES